MPVATYEQYCQMLDRALERGFAYPAINVTSTSTANAAIAAFAEAGSDGIIQVSTGGGEFASGQAVKNAAIGAISLAQHVHLVAQEYDILIAFHTDHCHPNKVEIFLCIIEETENVECGTSQPIQFTHADGSELPLDENIRISRSIGTLCQKRNNFRIETEL